MKLLLCFAEAETLIRSNDLMEGKFENENKFVVVCNIYV